MLDERLGYLHSCPTNLGTGMRASSSFKKKQSQFLSRETTKSGGVLIVRYNLNDVRLQVV